MAPKKKNASSSSLSDSEASISGSENSALYDSEASISGSENSASSNTMIKSKKRPKSQPNTTEINATEISSNPLGAINAITSLAKSVDVTSYKNALKTLSPLRQAGVQPGVQPGSSQPEDDAEPEDTATKKGDKKKKNHPKNKSRTSS